MAGLTAIIEGRNRAADRRDALFGPSAQTFALGPMSSRIEDGTLLGLPPMPGQGMFSMLSDTGRMVTPEEARQAPTVLSCRTLIAGALSRMEWRVLRVKDRRRDPDTSHAVYRLLNRRPNKHHSAQTFREAMIYDALDYSNAYAYIVRKGGKAVALNKLRSDRMLVQRHHETNELVYLYSGSADGDATPIPAYNVLHIRGPSQDGLLGDSMPMLMRTAIAIELDAQSFFAGFFRNGARPGGVLSAPGKLSDDEKRNLTTSWQSGQGGTRNAFRVALLEMGIKFDPTSVTPDEGQLIEARQMARQVICGFYAVPPHMIGDDSKQSYASAEQGAMQFVDYCLAVWAARHEGEVQCKLIDERENIETEIHFGRLLKGDRLSRMRAQALGVANGINTRNECRAEEGLPPVDGGDAISVPLNMAILDSDAMKEGTPGPLAIGSALPAGAKTEPPPKPEPPTPDPETETPDPAPPAPDSGVPAVADTAMNGAQLIALGEIVEKAKAGLIPIDTAKAMIALAFPSAGQAQLEAIFKPLEGAINDPPPPTPEPPAAPEPTDPDPTPEPEPGDDDEPGSD